MVTGRNTKLLLFGWSKVCQKHQITILWPIVCCQWNPIRKVPISGIGEQECQISKRIGSEFISRKLWSAQKLCSLTQFSKKKEKRKHKRSHIRVDEIKLLPENSQIRERAEDRPVRKFPKNLLESPKEFLLSGNSFVQLQIYVGHTYHEFTSTDLCASCRSCQYLVLF